ncbi:MAG: hypothetical protein NZ874_04585 [Fimbriimonadales bacterium]|nr:hypothetical protein [Fimbriimonadales bacterium]
MSRSFRLAGWAKERAWQRDAAWSALRAERVGKAARATHVVRTVAYKRNGRAEPSALCHATRISSRPHRHINYVEGSV